MRASTTLGPQRFVHGVMVPVLESVGQLWQEGALCVAQEHAASALVRSHVGALLSSLSGRGASARTAIATTPAGELHELGALMAAVVAVAHGWRTVYLGPNLPAAEIANAARLSGAELVLLSCVSVGDVDTQAELERLSAELPSTVRVLVGGRAAAALGPLPPRVHRVHSLTELEGRLSG
jgi:methanogenic corrinoid protein MtbC1